MGIGKWVKSVLFRWLGKYVRSRTLAFSIAVASFVFLGILFYAKYSEYNIDDYNKDFKSQSDAGKISTLVDLANNKPDHITTFPYFRKAKVGYNHKQSLDRRSARVSSGRLILTTHINEPIEFYNLTDTGRFRVVAPPNSTLLRISHGEKVLFAHTRSSSIREGSQKISYVDINSIGNKFEERTFNYNIATAFQRTLSGEYLLEFKERKIVFYPLDSTTQEAIPDFAIPAGYSYRGIRDIPYNEAFYITVYDATETIMEVFFHNADSSRLVYKGKPQRIAEISVYENSTKNVVNNFFIVGQDSITRLQQSESASIPIHHAGNYNGDFDNSDFSPLTYKGVQLKKNVLILPTIEGKQALLVYAEGKDSFQHINTIYPNGNLIIADTNLVCSFSSSSREKPFSALDFYGKELKVNKDDSVLLSSITTALEAEGDFSMPGRFAVFTRSFQSEFVFVADVKNRNGTLQVEYRQLNPEQLFSAAELTIETQWDLISVIIFLTIFIIIFSFIYLVIKNHNESEEDKEEYHPTVTIPSLQYKIRHVESVLGDLKRRYNIMLFIGIGLGLCGAMISSILFQSGDIKSLENWGRPGTMITVLRPIIMTVFIETFAFYFLKQYRIIFNEYKLFYGVYLRLLNYYNYCDVEKMELSVESKKDIKAKILADDFVLYEGSTKVQINEFENQFDIEKLVKALKG